MEVGEGTAGQELSSSTWEKRRANKGFPGGSAVKNLPADARDTGSIPGWGRSPGGGNDNPLQYSCMKSSMERGAWQATVHGVTKSQTRLKGLSTHIRIVDLQCCANRCCIQQCDSVIHLSTHTHIYILRLNSFLSWFITGYCV